MLMNAMFPGNNNNNNNNEDKNKEGGEQSKTQLPFPLGLLGSDLFPHPFLMPDFFYPFPFAPGLYPHLAGLVNLGDKNPAVAAAAAASVLSKGGKLNFGIDAILKQELEEKKEHKELDEDSSTSDDKNKPDTDDSATSRCNKYSRCDDNTSEQQHKPDKTIKPPTATEKNKDHLSGGFPQSLNPFFPRPPMGLGLPHGHPSTTGLPPPHPAFPTLPALHFGFPHIPVSGTHNAFGGFERRVDPSRSHCSPKRKRSWSRAVFSALQRKGLEKRFEVQKYVTKPDRRQLAAMLGLTDAQAKEGHHGMRHGGISFLKKLPKLMVKVWFQNRRMKWRHMEEQRKKREQEDQRQKREQTTAEPEVHEDTMLDMEEHVQVTDSEIESDAES